MTFKSLASSFGLFISLALSSAGAVHASTVDVNYTISGSAGNWVYDFTVKNNIPNTDPGYDFIYFVGAEVFPTGTFGTPPAGWSPSFYGFYNDYVNFSTPTNLAPGQTLTGFDFTDTSLAPAQHLDWVVGVGTSRSTSYAIYGVASAVPEPSTWAMMILGFCGVGFMAYRKNALRLV